MTVFSTGGTRCRQISGDSGKIARDGNDTAQLQFMVTGEMTELAAEAALDASSIVPDTFDGMRIDNYTWSEVERDAYKFNVNYTRRRLDPDEWTLAVATSGGSIKMTNALATAAYAASGSTAPDFGGGIDVKDGKPQGVDRVIPTNRYDLTYRMNRPADILAFADLASELTGTLNSAPILGRPAGEMLLVDVNGNFGSDADPELTFSWAASKNATLSIGTIANIVKQGHDYLWILYEETKTGTGADQYVVSTPRAAYVERIYTLADHNLLGLIF